MKQYLPYNVLLITALAVSGLTLFYNLALRDSFAVTVGYTMPAVPKREENVILLEPGESEGEPEGADEGYDYAVPYNDEETQLLSVTFPLEINYATEAELRFIPQVGDVTAQRIIQYRDVLGKYTSLEQLKEIKGIGGATFEKIARYLYIEDEDAEASLITGDTAEESAGE